MILKPDEIGFDFLDLRMYSSMPNDAQQGSGSGIDPHHCKIRRVCECGMQNLINERNAQRRHSPKACSLASSTLQREWARKAGDKILTKTFSFKAQIALAIIPYRGQKCGSCGGPQTIKIPVPRPRLTREFPCCTALWQPDSRTWFLIKREEAASNYCSSVVTRMWDVWNVLGYAVNSVNDVWAECDGLPTYVPIEWN